MFNLKRFLFLSAGALLIFACKQEPSQLQRITGVQISIDESLQGVDSIENFVRPYRERVDQVLDSVLAYAPEALSKSDGEYNTSMGNFMADLLLEAAGPIFNSRTGKTVDFAVHNHGGIRSVISKGDITPRTAYEVMPFENILVVVELQGKDVREMVRYLIRSSRPHPIAGMQIILEPSGELNSVNIQGRPFDESRTYYVATSNYLASGGDDMGFFRNGLETHDLNYLVRNVIIDHFAKLDTIRASVDERFIKRGK